MDSSCPQRDLDPRVPNPGLELSEATDLSALEEGVYWKERARGPRAPLQLMANSGVRKRGSEPLNLTLLITYMHVFKILSDKFRKKSTQPNPWTVAKISTQPNPWVDPTKV